MQLPDDAPVSIIDPFVQLHLGSAAIEVPIPQAALRDTESLANWPTSALAGHVFTKDPDMSIREEIAGDMSRWLRNLDKFRIDRAGVPISSSAPREVFDQLSEYPDRIFVSLRVDPHEGMQVFRRISELAGTYPIIKSVSLTPHYTYPPIALNSKEYFPVYAKCVEMDLSVFVNVGFPGPRVPAFSQDPTHLDEVCWFFPELTVVMRHGGVPWVDVCVAMMLRWPNLYYATTAFSPRYYPKPIIDFLNTRGSRKIMFAGYWPILTYERVFSELSALPIKESVWPDFLRGNAERAFRLLAD